MENTECKGKGTAESIDSYKEALIEVLDLLKPKHVFEWGPGCSTKIFEEYSSIETIDSVEHKRAWLEKAKEMGLKKVNYILEEDLREYPYVVGRMQKYDLVFVDGRQRSCCLETTKRIKMHDKTVVILHDAERERYQEAIELFIYNVWRDDGHTVIMMDNEGIYNDFS